MGKAAFFIYPDGEVSLTGPNEVVGYPDGLYRPDQKVTRGEFATMVIKALGLHYN